MNTKMQMRIFIDVILIEWLILEWGLGVRSPKVDGGLIVAQVSPVARPAVGKLQKIEYHSRLNDW
jgi:hypothetical protein